MDLSRSLAVAVAAACLVSIPAAAGAAPLGDAPAHSKKGPGRIEICKSGMDIFDVYADGGVHKDGGALRNASLSHGKNRCTDWGHIPAGIYDIGFTQRIASQKETVILAKLKFGKKKIYKKFFDGQGVMTVPVRPGQTVKLHLESRRTGH